MIFSRKILEMKQIIVDQTKCNKLWRGEKVKLLERRKNNF